MGEYKYFLVLSFCGLRGMGLGYVEFVLETRTAGSSVLLLKTQALKAYRRPVGCNGSLLG